MREREADGGGGEGRQRQTEARGLGGGGETASSCGGVQRTKTLIFPRDKYQSFHISSLS